MSEPLISVVTVVYNAVETIEETIMSVVNQDYKKIEFVIIDGGSTDGTLDIIRQYEKQITYWKSEVDGGIYDAMNKAILKCEGDWLYFIGADDTLVSNSIIGEVVSTIRRKNEIIYGDVLFKIENRIYDGPFDKWKIATKNICHQSIFYPRSVFEAYQFNTKYKVFADYYLNLILFNDQRWHFKYVPLIVAKFNDGGISGSRTKDIAFEADFVDLVKRNFPFKIYLYRYLRSKMAKMLKQK